MDLRNFLTVAFDTGLPAVRSKKSPDNMDCPEKSASGEGKRRRDQDLKAEVENKIRIIPS
jgi:hypothetical protein